jgi:uncharacterized membrane protein
MHFPNIHYFPISLSFYLVLLSSIIVLGFLVSILGYAYRSIGISERYIFILLLLSLLGSYINIPVAQLPEKEVLSDVEITHYGIYYIVPAVIDWPGTIIAVNLGGAVIPTFLSIYLLVKNRLYIRSILGIAIIAAISYLMATPVRGVGIAEPFFIPPVVTAIVALLLSWRQAPPLAYISGSLGTLIGADLLNLSKVQGLAVPVASIGGAGTFDGIFLTGIIAVVLASLLSIKSFSKAKPRANI